MATTRKIGNNQKKQSVVVATKPKKANSTPVVILPDSFLARGGGMVPTVRLGKRASQKAI